VNHFITARMRGFGDYSSDGTASTVKARDYKDATDLVSVGYTSSSFANYKEGIGTVRASGGDLGGGSETIIAFPAEMSGTQSATTVNLSPALSVKHTTAVATHDVAGTMLSRASSGGFSNSIDHAAAGYMALQKSQVRRLTPIECERLQGFPDNYTDIRLNDKQTPDGPRYKAMGNSMAVPVMNWIGKRIQEVEANNG
jgi:DNA (cytosine-5)-methyltransferase 1